MCGRFAIYSSVQSIVDYAKIINKLENFQPNYNVAPSHDIPVIIRKPEGNYLALYRWGLLPFWAKDMKIGYKMINTRSETIREKPSFRQAFQKRRCLIPANGFYEWRKSDKQPFFISIPDRDLFCFAGIREKWISPEGVMVQSCSIITTEPNETMFPIHNRMPVILLRSDEDFWLADDSANDDLHKLLQPYPREMMAITVGREVNSPANNYPGLVQAAP